MANEDRSSNNMARSNLQLPKPPQVDDERHKQFLTAVKKQLEVDGAELLQLVERVSEIISGETSIESSVPTGSTINFAGASAPDGWLLCDGSSYPVSGYRRLHAVIGYTFGGSGANFNVPDLRGRTMIGLDNLGGTSANRVTASQADSVGGASGAQSHTLAIANMPAHNHGGGSHQHNIFGTNVAGFGSGTHPTLQAVNGGSSGATLTITASIASAGTIIGTQGSGSAVTHMDPYMAMGAIIKT